MLLFIAIAREGSFPIGLTRIQAGWEQNRRDAEISAPIAGKNPRISFFFGEKGVLPHIQKAWEKQRRGVAQFIFVRARVRVCVDSVFFFA